MKRLIQLASLAFALALTTTVGARDLPSGERASLAGAADADLASHRAGTAGGGGAISASEREALGRAVDASPHLDDLTNDDHDLLIIAIVVGVVILIIVL
jgi:hypothetical protein